MSLRKSSDITQNNTNNANFKFKKRSEMLINLHASKT